MILTDSNKISTAKSRVTRRGTVAAGAVAAALLVWTVAVPVLGIRVTVPEGPGSAIRSELAFEPVLVTALVAVLAGWALLATLERFTARARPIWTVIAIVVLVLTLPYLPGFTITERIVLASMHLALAGVLISGLRQPAQTAT